MGPTWVGHPSVVGNAVQGSMCVCVCACVWLDCRPATCCCIDTWNVAPAHNSCMCQKLGGGWQKHCGGCKATGDCLVDITVVVHCLVAQAERGVSVLMSHMFSGIPAIVKLKTEPALVVGGSCAAASGQQTMCCSCWILCWHIASWLEVSWRITRC